jgi:hypothetical protein
MGLLLITAKMAGISRLRCGRFYTQNIIFETPQGKIVATVPMQSQLAGHDPR